MTAAIGLHVICDNASDEQLNRALVYCQRAKSEMITIAAGAQLDRGMLFVERVRTVLPGIKIFWRHLEDTGIWLRLAPSAWWITRVERSPATLEWAKRNEIIFVTDNETSGDDDTIRNYVKWQVQVMALLHTHGLHAAVGRFATGNIKETQYALLKPMFEAMNAGDYFSPNEYHDLTPEASGGHINRYKLAWEAAGKPLPTAIGEFGLAAEHKSDKGYLAVNWSGKQAFEAGRQYFEQWYKPNGVSVFWYCIGGFGWPHFQMNEELLECLEVYAQETRYLEKQEEKKEELPVVVQPPPKPSPIPKPTTAGEGKRVIIDDYFHLRYGPGLAWDMVSVTKSATGENGDMLRIYPDTVRKDKDNDDWIYADVLSGDNSGLSGWMVYSPEFFTDVKATGESPVVTMDSDYTLHIKVRGLTKAQAELFMKLISNIEYSIEKEVA